MLWQSVIDSIYPAGRKVRGILLSHSSAVAAKALDIAARKHLSLEPEVIENAVMLHDVGIIFTDAPRIDCLGTAPYLAHGAIGADVLRAAGVDERYALVAERHTGAGLTADEIALNSLPLPSGRDYMPHSLLERLVCYADCFFSKGGDGKEKALGRVETSMASFGPGVLSRFRLLHDEFK